MKIFKILIEGFNVAKLKELYEVMYSLDERNIKYTSWQSIKLIEANPKHQGLLKFRLKFLKKQIICLLKD